MWPTSSVNRIRIKGLALGAAGILFLAGRLYAETLELVTYYPPSGTAASDLDPQFSTVRVRDDAGPLAVPADGTLLVAGRLEIGGRTRSLHDLAGVLDVHSKLQFSPSLPPVRVAFTPGSGGGNLGVGIGAVPAAGTELLVSTGTLGTNADIQLDCTGDNPSTVVISARADHGFMGTLSGNPFYLGTNNTSRILIDVNGRVAMPSVGTPSGSASSTYPFKVTDTAALVARFAETSGVPAYSGVVINTSAVNQDPVLIFNNIRILTGWTIGNDASDGNKFKFRPGVAPFGAAGANDVLVIQPNGRVGMGTTTPQATLEVTTGAAATGALLAPRNNADVAGPVDGMVYYDTRSKSFIFRQGGAWRGIGGVVTGTYTGTGARTESFTLGFRPSKVELWIYPGVNNYSVKFEKTSSMPPNQALITSGIDAQVDPNAIVKLWPDTGLNITVDGFTVAGDGEAQTNRATHSYHYIAYR